MSTTVAWMMATLITLGALALGATASVLGPETPDPPGRPSPLAAIPGLLLFVALITGSLALALTPLVYWFRPTSPPWMITLVALLIDSSPWIVLLAQAWR